jgi:hypothetical protein
MKVADECQDDPSDTLIGLPAQSTDGAHRPHWAVGARWTLVLSVVAWLILIAAAVLVWR